MAKNRLRKRILGFITFRALTYLVLAAVVAGSYYYFRFLGKDRIALVVAGNEIPLAGEKRSLQRLLVKRKNTEIDLLKISSIAREPDGLNRYSLVWIHEPDSLNLSLLRDTTVKASILSYLEKGGSLLLSQRAASLVYDLGLETVPLQTMEEKLIDEGYGRKKGLRAYNDHPVFAGLHKGAYILHPKADVVVRKTGFFGENVPEKGRVLAVGWSYVFLDEDEKMMLEYNLGKGRVLAAGAFLEYSMPNLQRTELELFTQNLLAYLCGHKLPGKASYWTYNHRDTYPVALKERRENLRQTEPPSVQPSPFCLERDTAGQAFWDVAGKRILIMGKEEGGIDEVWVHPFMALQEYRLGFSRTGSDRVTWLDREATGIKVHPAFFSRIYRIGNDTLTETVAAHPDQPLGRIHYSWTGTDSLLLRIGFTTRFRLMWPYSQRATEDLYYGFEKGLNAFVVHNESLDQTLVLGMTQQAEFAVAGPYATLDCSQEDPEGERTDTFLVKARMGCMLGPGTQQMDVLLAAGTEGLNRILGLYRRTIARPGQVLTAAMDYQEEMHGAMVQLRTPDEDLNRGYEWARIATDRLFVATPGIGGSLVAGYGTTERGWDGGHRVNGRPGYAWYFGRDAIWSAFAMLHYGDFEKVREILETFNRFQSPTGKIYHELTTSGFVHYDAADATPLYLVLAGRYLRHSGDQAFIRKTWKNIKKAIDFCYSTDTDGDGLIENTGVGHGWVEGGALFGSKTTLYLASVWAEALKETAYITRHMKYDGEENYERDYANVLKTIRTDFRNPDGEFYAHGKYPDDTYNPEPTVMPAVPMLFGQLEPAAVKGMLRAYASNEFSSDWGTRIIGASGRNFNPLGYHTGSIWPLYTGWTSLAEYRYGLDLQGYTHLMDNVLVYRDWALGFAEEVLHGEVYTPRGVCSHQGWSETMVIQPVLEGMLGLEPDALEHRLKLTPVFPAGWDSLELRNLRVGGHTLDFSMVSEEGVIRYQFTHRGPRALNLEFTPGIPGFTRISGISINGEPVKTETLHSTARTSVSLKIKLRNRATVEVRHKGISALLPDTGKISPGDSTGSFRVVETEHTERGIRVLLENKPLSETAWQVWSDVPPGTPLNATLLRQEGKVYTYLSRFPSRNDKYVRMECFLPVTRETGSE